MHRLFVALRPPRAIRLQLLDIMGGIEGARWQNDDQLHLTLRYIGEVERSVAEDIATALGSIWHGQEIEIALKGVGAFDRKGIVDALWAGVKPHDALTVLHRKIDHLLVRLGLPPEGRAYLPHITLARFGSRGADISDFMMRHAALSSMPVALDRFSLFESSLGHEGAHYTLIARYPLA